jgi:SAM-dependent methyltransferase
VELPHAVRIWQGRQRRRLFAWVLARRPGHFVLGGKRFAYFNRYYNLTYLNERAIEIPVAQALLARGGRILEVGNVLHHYGSNDHTVVDKYEAEPGVVNVDILDYRPTERFDAILCLSTLEHIGYDEDITEPDKPRRAIRHVRSLLAPGGVLLATIPVGYNQSLDGRIRQGAIVFDETRAMKRVPATRNKWTETGIADALNATYGPYANALIFGWIHDPVRSP